MNDGITKEELTKLMECNVCLIPSFRDSLCYCSYEGSPGCCLGGPGVTQSGRDRGLGPRSRLFESGHPDHLKGGDADEN